MKMRNTGRGFRFFGSFSLVFWLFRGKGHFPGRVVRGTNKILGFSLPAPLRKLDRGRALIIISLDMNVPLRVGSDWPVRNASPWPSLEGVEAKRRPPPLKGIFLAGIKTNTIFRIPDWQIFRRSRSGQLRLVENFDAF